MAHEIVFDETRGINPVAFVGETPWHGLGQRLEPGQPMEVWAKAAGMDFSIDSAPALYMDGDGLLRAYEGRKVLRRSDNQAGLSIVSNGYKVVQPGEVLDFFTELARVAGYQLNTAGVLFAGRKYWALAELGQEARIKGQDLMNGYLLLATSCDGSLATTAQPTSVRVVCNNTLSFAVDGAGAGRAIKVPHSRAFDAEEVRAELGRATGGWGDFVEQANALAERKVGDREAVEWLVRVFGKLREDEEVTEEILELQDAKTIKHVLTLYKGAGLGSNLRSAEGTAWGLVNAVTEWADHRRNTRTADNRLDSAWFGEAANIKRRAFGEALRLAA